MTASTTPDRPADRLREYSHREVLEIMSALLAAMFTALISTTVVATALPTLMADLGGTQRQYTWVITASLLTMTVSTPIWGKLADLFSKKLLTQISILTFVVGSIIAGLTTQVSVMMAARALQGVAMGGLIASAQAVMGVIISPRERGRYSGYMAAVMAVATVSGPLLGGYLTDTLGWRWCFFVPVPLAIGAFILLQMKLNLPTLRSGPVRFDWAGGVLVPVTASLPMLWITFAGSDYDWISLASAAFLVAFAVLTVLLIVIELRVPEPVLPLRSLKDRTAILMTLASLGVGIAMFGAGVFVTQYFQLGDGVSPSKAGMMLIPMIIAQMASSTIAGQIVSRTGRYRRLMIAASAMMALGLFGLGTVSPGTPYLPVAASMIVFGIGVGALVQNVVLAVQNVVDVTEIGAVSAAVSFFRSLGGAIGVTALGAILTASVAGHIESGLAKMGVPADRIGTGSGDTKLDISGLPGPVQELFHHSYVAGFATLFTIAAVIALTSLAAILLTREVPLRTTIALEHEEADHWGPEGELIQMPETGEIKLPELPLTPDQQRA